MTFGDHRKSLSCHPYPLDYQVAVLHGDNSDIILKKKYSYNACGMFEECNIPASELVFEFLSDQEGEDEE